MTVICMCVILHLKRQVFVIISVPYNFSVTKATQVRQSSSLARDWSDAGWLILVSLILTPITELKKNINKIYIVFLIEYITSRIKIPPHPIYYKKDWNSTNTSHHLYYKTDSISTNRHILRCLLTVYFGTPSMFITLWFGFDYGTHPPLGTLII
jgi:hypothetical protein